MTETIYPAEYNPRYMDPPPPCTCNAMPRVVIRGSYCARHINSGNSGGVVPGGSRRWHDEDDGDGELNVADRYAVADDPMIVLDERGQVPESAWDETARLYADQTCTLDEWKAAHGR